MVRLERFTLNSPRRRVTIAKNQNTFAKRQREMDKRFKAQEKLARREERKSNPTPVGDAAIVDDDPSDAEELDSDALDQ